MIRLLGYIADKLMNAFAPVVAQRSVGQMQTEDWLADVEADHDSWAPDELWAARHKLADPEPPSGVSVTPAAPVVRGGGHLHPDVEILLANIDRMFKKLNP